jgi:hypothetical protein
MHIPESYILNPYSPKDVVQQINAFDILAANKIMAGGFSAIFLELISTDEEVMNLLKAIDIRLNMLRTSSTNYTTILDQWMLFYYPDSACYNTYKDSIKRVANGVHSLYLYVKATVQKDTPANIKQRLDDFKAFCANGSCKDTTEALLSGLTGGSQEIFKCDMSQILY